MGSFRLPKKGRSFARRITSLGLFCLSIGCRAWVTEALAQEGLGTAGNETTTQYGVVVLCPPELQPTLQPWVAVRREAGWKVVIHSPPSSALACRDLVCESAQTDPQLRYLLIVGDCSFNGDALPTCGAPAFHQAVPISHRFGGMHTAVTDLPFADVDGDGKPDLAVGRWPVSDARELKTLVSKQLAYEQARDYGPWRRRIELVAGVGGFGILADKTIETAARMLIDQSLPGGIQVNMTHVSPSSPYCPGPECFHQTVQQRYGAGGLAWVYLGHGQVTELDRIQVGEQWLPIMDANSVSRLPDPGPQRPIALMLACYTGAFDARVDCLAEQLIASAAGPVAVLAGSRVTMPYGNAVLGGALLDSWFADRPQTLGDVWRQAQCRVLDHESPDANPRPWLDAIAGFVSPTGSQLADERREHLYLYNLLGDPTLPLSHALPIALEAPTSASAGHSLTVRGDSPLAGVLRIELRRPRGWTPKDEPGGTSESRYQLANHPAVAVSEQKHVWGPFSAELTIPSDCHGPLQIVAEVDNAQGHALGSTRILIP